MISIEKKINNSLDSNRLNDNNKSDDQNNLQNDLIAIQKLKSSVIDYQLETNQLKKEVEQLKEVNNNLLTEVQNLSTLLNIYRKKESTFKLAQEDLEKLKEENDSLKNLLLKERNKYKSELRLKDSIYNHDVEQTNIMNENLKRQNGMFSTIKKLNDILYFKNNELKRNIDDLKKEEKEKIDKLEVKFNKKFDKYKVKMIDFLRKNVEEKYKKGGQYELNNKLNILHIQELINEIENQGIEVEDLLKERQKLKLKITQLNYDLQIYQKVINTMTKKNQTFQKKLKTISNNLKEYNLLSSTKNDKVIEISTEPDEKSIKIISLKKYGRGRNLSSNDKTILKQIENEQWSNDSSKRTMRTIYNNNRKFLFINKNRYSYDTSNYNNTTQNLTKVSEIINKGDNSKSKSKNRDKNKYEEIIKEKEKYKELYEFNKEKNDIIKEKYSNIFNIYNEALEKIYKEDIIKLNKENIYINLNDFKNFKFENMTSEQKYGILIKLINNIAPLVYKNDIENNLFSQKISKVKEKYHLKSFDQINSFNFSNQNNPSTSNGVINMKVKSSNINDSFRTTATAYGGVKPEKNLNSFEGFKKIFGKKKEQKEKSLLHFGKSKINLELIPKINLFLD